MQGPALPGFRDFYPEELALRNHLFATWRAVARRYGFQEYDGPPLEPLELYTAKSASSGDGYGSTSSSTWTSWARRGRSPMPSSSPRRSTSCAPSDWGPPT